MKNRKRGSGREWEGSGECRDEGRETGLDRIEGEQRRRNGTYEVRVK